MRSTCRSFMAAILFITVAGVVSAQDASAAPPPVPPEVAKPVELQPIPIAPAVEPAPPADPSAPAVEPAPPADQSAAAVEPVAPAVVEPPAAEKPDVTTSAKRVTKKTVKKPADKPAVEVSESVKPAAAAASTAVVDTSLPPPDAAAKTAPAEAIAPPPPAASAPIVDTSTEQTTPETKMGIGGWLLAGIVVVAAFGIITLIRRRKTRTPTAMVDFTNPSLNVKEVLNLKPAPAPRL